MRRVLVLSHIMPPGVDGGSKILLQLAKVWQNKAKRLRVFTTDAYSTDDFISPNKKKLPTGKVEIDTLKVTRLKTNRSLHKFFGLLKKISLIKPIKNFFSLLQTGPIIKLPLKQTKQFKPDLILAGVYPTTIPVYAWILSKLTKSKLAFLPCFHPDDLNFYRWPLTPILKQADFIYALTEFEKNFYINQMGIREDKVIVFTPWVSEGIKLSPQDKIELSEVPTLVFLGVQAAHKRIEMLIDAFEQLKQSDEPLLKKLKLIIAGKETLYTPKIKEKLDQLPEEIKENIELVGEFANEQEKELLDQAWLTVNPSEHESLGLVFLESWARKKPVIAAKLKPLTHLIEPGKTGYLFEKDNPDDLTDKIKQAVKDKQKIINMGEKGYQKVIEEFSKDAVFKKFET
jgi:glycosyltransferase involved in cell wall biosynthesis